MKSKGVWGGIMGGLFSEEEMKARLDAVRAEMAQKGFDVLILTDPCNIYYLTGYDAWSFYVPQAVAVTAAPAPPVWFGRAMDAAGARLTTGMPDDQIIAYGDEYVQAADKHPYSLLSRELRSREWRLSRIAVEKGNYYLTVRAFEALRDSAPDAEICDGSLLVNWVRAIKSPAEIEQMRHAAEIVQHAMSVAMETVRVGVCEHDAAAAIYKALIGGASGLGGDYASSPPLMPAGARIACPHLSWTDRCYEAGDQVNFELVACRNRYHTPLGRTAIIGPANKARLAVAEAIVGAIDVTLEQIAPDMRACDVERIWQEAARRSGFEKSARCGYSIGLAYPPTFGEQTISLRPSDNTVLKEGMTLHLMPAIWNGADSCVITEPFVVTKNGCETFCKFPRKIFEII